MSRAEKKYTQADLNKAVRDAIRVHSKAVIKRMNSRTVLYKQTHLPLFVLQYGALAEAITKKAGRLRTAAVICFGIIAFRETINEKTRRMNLIKVLGGGDRWQGAEWAVKDLLKAGLILKDSGHFYSVSLEGRKVIKSFSLKVKTYEKEMGVSFVDFRLTYWKNRAHLLYLTDLEPMFGNKSEQ